MHTDYDFENSLGYWMSMATHALHRTVSHQLAPQGITFRQAQVVGWLVLEGELSQAELVRRLMIEPPTLVRLLDRMEDAGLIRRDGDPRDRRRRIVRLTDEAGPLWEKIASTLKQVRRLAGRGLSADEHEQLKRLLRKVHGNLGGELPQKSTVAAGRGKGNR
jgi:MarR family transcriptional regulator for hemolysin